jgi:hypothetical protein
MDAAQPEGIGVREAASATMFPFFGADSVQGFAIGATAYVLDDCDGHFRRTGGERRRHRSAGRLCTPRHLLKMVNDDLFKTGIVEHDRNDLR